MPLSLTTRRRQQTSNAKWFSQQHLNQLHQSQHHQDISATNLTQATNNLIRHHFIQQPVRKQRSFIDSRFTASQTGGRTSHLSRGLSVGRSHDIVQQQRTLLKKQSSTAAQHHAFANSGGNHVRTDELVKRNITTACGIQSGGGGELLRNSHKVQAWSSTSSILKTLDKELAQLNGTVAKPKDIKITKPDSSKVDNVKNIKSKADAILSSSTNHTSRKATKSEVNKVNLSIILSQAFHSTKEENELLTSEPEGDESDDVSTDCNKCVNNQVKSKDSKKTDNIKSTSTTTTRPAVLAQQRRALYHNTRLTPNIAATANINTSGYSNNSSALENSQNINASPPSLIVQKRPPLVRAMSAPVRSFDETSKGSFLASKRKSRRRKLNTRNISCDKGSPDVLGTKDLNRKVLTRSKSVAPDVITLVSLISSEGSDSEKDDTPTASHAGSPTRRAPSLRKTGKSVSFQENYPPTFQFASKEYSHMLRRGSIAPLAQRIKTNRPPTAPPGSIFHTASKFNNEMSETSNEACEEKENFSESLNNNNTKVNIQTTVPKTLEEEYEFPEYVRSRKERECWKLYMKMSTKGVNITYDTILRGMLTPTEFRQLQKQRDVEEAKAKENLECSKVLETKPKECSTAIERLKEGLLKN